MCSVNLIYFIPIIPLLSRGLLCVRHHKQMGEILGEEEQDREAHRSHIVTLSGFSFAGLLAVALLDVTLQQDFHFAIFYLLISFLCYIFALNLQSYKSKRWHDQFATALMDSASISLILSIVSILYTQRLRASFALGVTVLALLIWSIDHVVRLRIQWNYLNVKKEVEVDERQKGQV